MADSRLHVLLVEDKEDDVALIRDVLRRAYDDVDLRQIQTAGEMATALHERNWDAVLSDFTLPQFNGLEALRLLKRIGRDLPFIVVTGSITEEMAVAVMKAGAHDYVMKDKLIRLLPALQRELHEAEIRRARALAEKELRESEDRQSIVAQTLPLAFYTARRSVKRGYQGVTWVSRNVQQLTGFPAHAFLENRLFWKAHIHPDDADWKSPYAGMLNGPICREYRWQCANGEYRWFFDQWLESSSSDGDTVEIQGICLDITERKQMDEALRESERRFRLSVENLLDGFAILAAVRNESGDIQDLCFDYMNTAGGQICGRSVEDTVGCTLRNLYPGLSEGSLWDDLVCVISKGDPLQKESLEFEVYWNGRPAETRILDLRAVKLNDGLALTWRDVTDRVRAEQERMRLAAAVEHAGESIIITDKEGKITYVNATFELTTGFSKEEATESTAAILNSGKHDVEFFSGLWKTIAGGEIWKGRFTNRKKDGSLFEAAATVSPIIGSDGAIIEYIAVEHDMTRELQLEAQFRQTQKMEAIGALAAGIAHDFNNILTAILGYSEMAMESLTEGNAAYFALTQVRQAGIRAKELVHQILTFSREREQEYRPLRMDIVVKEVLKLLEATLPSTIEVVKHIHTQCGLVSSDPVHVHQIVMNLCNNACYAMPDGGILEIRVESVQVDECAAKAIQDLSAGNFVRLTVSDTGHGMDAATVDRIFEPFFTTKPEDKGSGLGLSTVYGIVASHGGAITVYSEVGHGTTFHVYFPLADDAGSEAVGDGNIEAPSGARGQRILLVDDETVLVELGTWMLKRLGYTVVPFDNAPAALEAFCDCPETYDLVITDLTMPHLSGLSLAKQAKRLRPDIPIILITGFSEALTTEIAAEAGIGEIVHKPMTLIDVSQAVHRALD